MWGWQQIPTGFYPVEWGFWVENLENWRLCVRKCSFSFREINFVHKGTAPKFEGREGPLIPQKSWMQGKQREAVKKRGWRRAGEGNGNCHQTSPNQP